jgi:hypothetical protein
LSKDDPKSKSSKTEAKNSKKRSPQDVFHEEIHAMELKEAAERHAEKNAICMKQLELEEKWQQLEKEKHQVKLRKMEIEAEQQKMQMTMMSNMTQLFMQQMGQGGGGQNSESVQSSASGSMVRVEQYVESQQLVSNHASSAYGIGVGGVEYGVGGSASSTSAYDGFMFDQFQFPPAPQSDVDSA